MFQAHVRNGLRRALPFVRKLPSYTPNSVTVKPPSQISPFHVSNRNISSIVAFRALRHSRGFASAKKKGGQKKIEDVDDGLSKSESSKLDIDKLTSEVIERATKDPTWAFKLYSTLVKKDIFNQKDRPRLQNWKCQGPPELFDEVDANHDGVIELHELQSWFEKHKVALMRSDSGPTAKKEMVTTVTQQQLFYVFLRKFVPFVGFGLSDTGIMVLTAGALDVTVGVWLSLTTLTAAALGNCMSNFVALWVVGLIESLSNRIGIPDPKLNRKQAELAEVHTWGTIGSVTGMGCGCLTGLAPLFLLGIAFEDDEDKLAENAHLVEEIEHKLKH